MLSIPHLIIIFLVALIFLGPEKLPEVARTLSKAMLEINRVTGNLKDTFQQEMNQLERDLSEKREAEALPATTPASAEPETHSESAAETQAEPEQAREALFAGHAASGEASSAESLATESHAGDAPVASAHGPRKPMQPEPPPASIEEPDGAGDTSGNPTDGHPSAA